MTVDPQRQKAPPPRKPLWPWLVVLVLTVFAIYSYHRLSDVVDEVMQNMPHEIINLFRDLLNEENRRQPTGPALDVHASYLMIPPRDV